MALINCPECGKEISDKATSCPNCGCPINEQSNNSKEEYLCCPKCHSKELHSEHKGFSGGKALVGAVLTGGIGLLAGTIGSKDVQITCLKCGKKFKAGEGLTSCPYNTQSNNNNPPEEITHIRYNTDSKNYDYNCPLCNKVYSKDMHHCPKCGRPFLDKDKIEKNTPNAGCAGIILLFIILTGTLITISATI